MIPTETVPMNIDHDYQEDLEDEVENNCSEVDDDEKDLPVKSKKNKETNICNMCVWKSRRRVHRKTLNLGSYIWLKGNI